MNETAVSVVIPIYNMERHLCDCLDSVLSQTLKNIEVVCIDDGSTDNSLALLSNYKLKHPNIIVLSQNHLGAGMARNYGMSVATGQFVAFMDSDDFYPNKNALQRLYNAAVEHEVLAARGSFSRYKEGKIINCFDGLQEKSRCHEEGFVNFNDFQFCFGFTTYIFNLYFLKNNGIFFPRYKRNEDPPFCAQALSEIGRFYEIPDVVYAARLTDKRIVYDYNMLCDIAAGYRDIICLAIRKKYEILLNDILNLLHKMDTFFDLSIYKGNIQLAHTLADIEDYVRLYRAHRQLEYEKSCLELFSKFECIIIYGAGRRGWEVCDFISDSMVNVSIDFAVTKININDCIVRKKNVKQISEFIEKKDDALVVIAVENEKIRAEMRSNAENLGFRHIVALDCPLVGMNAIID